MLAVRPLRRDSHTIQLGLDPDRAVVVEGADPAALGCLDLLDGTRTEAAVLTEAARRGIPDAAGTLGLLRGEGLLVDAHRLLPPGTPEPIRRRLLPEAAALALARPAHHPADVVRRRRQARIRVAGRGRLLAPVATGLAEAGVGHVEPAPGGQPGRRSVIIEAIRGCAPDTETRPLRERGPTFAVQLGLSSPPRLTALRYGSRGVPHLAAWLRDGTAVVGPLVRPRLTPCLRCVDLHRRDRDPAWPVLAAQLATAPDEPEACAAATVSAAAAVIVAEVLRHVDGERPDTLGRTVELTSPGRIRGRPWSAHPECDCGANRH